MLPSSKFGGACPPQGIFALQKSLRVGCDGGRGSSSQRGKSPRKEISRGNLLCAESGLTNLSYLRLLSVQKYVSTLNWYNRPYRAAWGARGAAAPLFPKESRENPFEGFSLGNFFLTADAVLLCAAKKNGVGTRTSWHVTPEAHWPYLATAGKTKNTAGVTRTKEVPYGRIFAHQSI